MADIAKLRAVLTAEATDLEKDMRRAGEEVKAFGKTGATASQGTGMLGGSMTAMKAVAGQLIAAGALAKAGQMAIQFGKDSIETAKNVEEMQSKFETVFKDQAPQVTAALSEMAGEMNRSKYDLMGYAATFQDTFVPLGFAREQAAEMSIQVVQLAEDLASFNNLNSADVARDLQSALVGNTETLRKYGVVAQEAQIKQYALDQGLWDGVGAMDAQTKANAILGLTIAGTTDAQGDAVRTADSLTNKTKGLDAAVKDLQLAVGQKLTPAMDLWTTGMTNAAQAAVLLLNWDKNITQALADHNEELRRNTSDYADYRDEMLRAAETAGKMSEAEAEIIRQYEDGIITGREWADAVAEIRSETGLLSETQFLAKASNDQRNEQMELLRGNAERAAVAEGLLAAATIEAKAAAEEAKTQTGFYSDALRGLSLAAEEARLAELLMKIAKGEAGEEEVKQEFRLRAVQQAYLDGSLTLMNFTAIVADGVISLEEMNGYLGLNVTETDALAASMVRGQQSALLLNNAINGLPTGRKIVIDVEQNWTQSGKVTVPGVNYYIPQAEGGDWMVSGPTLFLAGEAGPERATFQPVGGGGKASPAGSQVTIYKLELNGVQDARSLLEELEALK